MSIPLDRQQRDALITAHQGLVRRVARTMVRDVPRHVTVDDLVSFGQLGLIDAATRFDASRGVQFNTFAYYRIRGAIFDQVRKEHGRDPIYRARMGARAAVDDLLEERAAEGASAVDALDAARALAGLLEETATALLLEETAEALRPPEVPSPEAAAMEQDTAREIREALVGMPERERGLVEKVYLEGLTIEQAGIQLGMTKGWASRLHARALGRLRESLAHYDSPGG
jgi:RNA polymerase sigma factor for flagellar operon FliA